MDDNTDGNSDRAGILTDQDVACQPEASEPPSPRTPPAPTTIQKGIHKLASGKYRVRAAFGMRARGGMQRERTFPAGTGLWEMIEWQRRTRDDLKRACPPRVTATIADLGDRPTATATASDRPDVVVEAVVDTRVPATPGADQHRPSTRRRPPAVTSPVLTQAAVQAAMPQAPAPAPPPVPPHIEHDVLFIDDLVRLLRVSRPTLERLRRRHAFPIPELPKLDNRPRWSRQAVEKFLAGHRTPARGIGRGRPPHAWNGASR
jgi:hypothetical protein